MYQMKFATLILLAGVTGIALGSSSNIGPAELFAFILITLTALYGAAVWMVFEGVKESESETRSD